MRLPKSTSERDGRRWGEAVLQGRPPARVWRHTPGFSLLELLLATFIASVALASLVGFSATQGRAFRRADERLAASQTVRLALDALSRDLRQAGFDARGTAVEPVAAASSTTLALQQDCEGDGTVDGRSRELITYSFDPGVGTLSRIVGRQPMPLASGLSEDGFRFSYTDVSGSALDADGRNLDAPERSAIRRVSVALLVRNTDGRPLAGAVTNVALRNHPWTP